MERAAKSHKIGGLGDEWGEYAATLEGIFGLLIFHRFACCPHIENGLALGSADTDMGGGT